MSDPELSPAREFTPHVPEISLPKSGGAIRSVGEKFSLNPATGSGTVSMPIAMAPSRAAPELSLSYSSSAGNGSFGLGWSLNLGKITRKTENRLPVYDDDDIFIVDGSEDLVQTDVVQDGPVRITTYQPRTEGGFSWIRQYETTGGSWWLIISANNIRQWYGAYPDEAGNVHGPDPQAQIIDPNHPSRVFTWLLSEERDDRGNCTKYAYRAEDATGIDAPTPTEKNRELAQAQKYIVRIDYAKSPNTALGAPEFLFKIEFDYRRVETDDDWTLRSDPYSNYKCGFDLRTRRLCYRIRQFNLIPHRSTDVLTLNMETVLAYDETSIASRLVRAFHRRHDLRDGSPTSDDTPATEFGYTDCAPDPTPKTMATPDVTGSPAGLSAGYQFIDLEGEAVAGILSEQADNWYYRRNLGQAAFSAPVAISKPSGWSTLASGAQIMRLENDGHPSLVSYGQLPGFAERNFETGWGPFQAFLKIANINTRNPNLRWLDLTGDGKPELCILHDGFIQWYENEGTNGIGQSRQSPTGLDEKRGPAQIFQNGLETIFTSDMSGDGLSDIVRIRNGQVCYWPNLGYGKFGRRVTFHNSPQFSPDGEFDPARLRLGDIDGSGTTDLLYLGAQSTTYWLNCSGNSFLPPETLKNAPPSDHMTDVSLMDLLGNGTNCLVWSSSNPADQANPWRYLSLMTCHDLTQVDLSQIDAASLIADAQLRLADLRASIPLSSDNMADLSGLAPDDITFIETCGGVTQRPTKPYLLNSINNNMGSETRFSYKASTYFYLKDRAENRPWISRLPFPVHVVDRQEVIDFVSGNRAVSRFSFHHGYYDRAEREFRGFGRVDQWDMEGTNLSGDTLFHRNPILTKTWFHTGTHLRSNDNSAGLSKEFHATVHALQECQIDLQTGHSAKDMRQAKRALRGQQLRQEIYACSPLSQGQSKPLMDGGPYQVSESRALVKAIRLSDKNTDGIFQTLPDQTLTQVFETHQNDPRIVHELTLATDEFGQITQTAMIAYGRHQDHSLFPEQTRSHLVVSETNLTNKPMQTGGWHRLGLPVSSLSWEVGQDFNLINKGLADRDSVLALIKNDYEIDKYSVLAKGRRRLLSASVQLYRANADLGLDATPLDYGVVSSLALTCRSYAWVYSPEDIELGAGVFANSDFTDGKYLDPLKAGHAGLPLLRAFILTMPESELTRSGWWARDAETALSETDFYVPTRARDSWGNETSITMDELSLAPLAAIKHLSGGQILKTEAEIDYRVMASHKVLDPNGTMQIARFDTLGRVIQTAIVGPSGEGDQLDTINMFDPTSLATTWVQYSDYIGPSQPAYTHSYSRETHVSELATGSTPRWAETRVYSDGFGREALAKAKAAPTTSLPPTPRWLTTSKVIYDNKNNPVMQFEPYYTSTVAFLDGAEQHGVTPILHYDAMDRNIRTDMPDGTSVKVEFSAWEQASYDALDTFDPASALGYSMQSTMHLNTPTKQFLDSLGRPFRTEVENFTPGKADKIKIVSQVEMDVSGNPLRTIDSNGQDALVQHFDRAGRPIMSISNDAGTSFSLTAMDGQPRVAMLANGRRIEQEYDALRRPTNLWVTEPNGQKYVREAIVYSEDAPVPLANGKGQPWRVFDPCGWSETSGYDFKGAPLETTRHVLTSFVEKDGLEALTAWDQFDLTSPQPLPSEAFQTSSKMDAFGRPTSVTAPDGSEQSFTYDDGGGLQTVDLSNLPGGTNKSIVQNVAYDTKGRRTAIAYGNGTSTSYDYDPTTFRLTELKTLRGSAALQHFKYTYDPLGNITTIEDLAGNDVLPGYMNTSARREYTYDSLSRLVAATGREHGAQAGLDPRNIIDGVSGGHANDLTQMGRYTQRWEFDDIGNIQEWSHQGAIQNWTRDYTYGAAGNNRLTQTTVDQGGQPSVTDYHYDTAGNLTSFGAAGAPDMHIHQSTWNVDNQPETMVLHGNKTARYRYDASGERMVKRVETSGGYSVRLYLGGFEVYREFKTNGDFKSRKDTLHVSDGGARVVMIETAKTTDDMFDAQTPVMRWQFSDHIGSAAMEVDDTGQIISIEEFHAYGTTAWHWKATSVSQKRYRYTGMERDAESGLQYHSARYYMPWLGKWLSTDPLGMVDGACLWAYVRGNPVGLSDQSGEQSSGAIEEFDIPPAAKGAIREELKSFRYSTQDTWWVNNAINSFVQIPGQINYEFGTTNSFDALTGKAQHEFQVLDQKVDFSGLFGVFFDYDFSFDTVGGEYSAEGGYLAKATLSTGIKIPASISTELYGAFDVLGTITDTQDNLKVNSQFHANSKITLGDNQVGEIKSKVNSATYNENTIATLSFEGTLGTNLSNKDGFEYFDSSAGKLVKNKVTFADIGGQGYANTADDYYALDFGVKTTQALRPLSLSISGSVNYSGKTGTSGVASFKLGLFPIARASGKVTTSGDRFSLHSYDLLRLDFTKGTGFGISYSQMKNRRTTSFSLGTKGFKFSHKF